MGRRGRRGRRRRAITALLAVSILLTLSACSPAVGGITGLTVDAKGRLTIVVSMCDRPVDSLVVQRSDAAFDEYLGSWYSRELVRGDSRVTMGAGSQDPWVVDQEWDGEVQDGVTYVAWAVMADGSWRSEFIEFTRDDLQRLRSDRILVARYDERATASWHQLTPQQFTAEGCRYVS